MAKLLFSILVSTYFVSLISLVDGAPEYANIEENGWCTGSITGVIVYIDGEIVKFVLNGRDPVPSTVVTRFNFDTDVVCDYGNLNYFSTLFTEQQNGIAIEYDDHYVFLFPGGVCGDQAVVHVFNSSDNSSSTIEVNCLPVSLVYRPGQQRADDTIVGFCRCIHYCGPDPLSVSRYRFFKLMWNGRWMDILQEENSFYYTIGDHGAMLQMIYQGQKYYCPHLAYGLGCNPFSPVISQGTRLYSSKNEMLDQLGLDNLDDVNAKLMPVGHHIHHLVPVNNNSFSGLRIIHSNGSHSGYYHQYFSSESGFIGNPFHTDYIAFDSSDLSYLVTFANLNTLKIIKQDGTSKQFPLNAILDDPIRCQNMATEPNVHYLICLAGNGLPPLIISITNDQVTSRIIPVNSTIVRVGILTGDVFYLLTEKAEMLFYVMGSTIVYLGHYTLRQHIDIVVSSATSDIVCSNATDYTYDLLGVFIFVVIMSMLAVIKGTYRYINNVAIY